MVKSLRRARLLILALCLTQVPVWSADEIRSLSRQLKQGLQKQKQVSLGVLNFPYARGRTSTGSHLVSERLLTYLVQDDQRVIERRFIQTMLEQKMLWETGLADPQSMRQLATLLGVDAIVAGTLTDISDDKTEVNARVIKVDGAEILAAGSVIMPRVWSDFPRVPRVAQLAAPVPVFPQLGGMEQKIKTAPATGTHRRRHYTPSPVPSFGGIKQ